VTFSIVALDPVTGDLGVVVQSKALNDWMAVENLEERAAAPGWIDRRVFSLLQARRPS